MKAESPSYRILGNGQFYQPERKERAFLWSLQMSIPSGDYRLMVIANFNGKPEGKYFPIDNPYAILRVLDELRRHAESEEELFQNSGIRQSASPLIKKCESE